VFLFQPAPTASSQPPEKKADPSAVAIAKEWRYPGVVTVDKRISPAKSEAFCLERYKVKAKFTDVWDHYAAKSGPTVKFKDDTIQNLMPELKGTEKGHFMVFDVSHGQEAHFGQSIASKTIHVEIRKSGDEQTDICVLVGVR
jgi:hypothetical protein